MTYLSAQEMLKGAMNLIDEDRAEALYAARVDPRVISGGSAANTIVGVASFGVSAAYIGKVKQDPLGAASPTTSARPASLSRPRPPIRDQAPGAASSMSRLTASGR